MPEHHPIFERFDRWRGWADGGWSVNFLGVRTRDAFSAGMTGAAASQRRWVGTDYPAFDEEYFEWIDVLEAATSAREAFTMIELGAGWGRWLMIGAAATQQCGALPFHLVGVEAEPTHFRWMKEHFRDNHVRKDALTLINAAVAPEDGIVRFHIGDPAAWYGQAIDPNHSDAKGLSRKARLAEFVRRRRSSAGRDIVAVRAVTLASILGDLERVDLIDLDVQGAEADVLEAAGDGLAPKVKRIHVGTHSVDNEKRLRRLFDYLGWQNLNDYASLAESDTPYGRISFQDGVQTWVNPRL